MRLANWARSLPWARCAPWAFIVVWSCGYVVAKYAAPYAPALTFLSLRFVGCIGLMLALMLWAGKRLPRGPLLWHTVAAGILMQFGYLAGCWMAVAQGLPAGVVALIVNVQPILTALLGGWMGERIEARQWVGLALGFVGVALVLSTRLGAADLGTVGTGAVLLASGALVSMTVGTLYQKRFCPGIDARASQVVQFAASLLLSAPLALAFETQAVVWSAPLWGALAFSVLILSGVGISLLLWLIERGQAVQVTGYMYWVPPVSSVMAWVMFDERLAPIAWLGFACVAIGVWAVVKANKPATH